MLTLIPFGSDAGFLGPSVLPSLQGCSIAKVFSCIRCSIRSTGSVHSKQLNAALKMCSPLFKLATIEGCGFS